MFSKWVLISIQTLFIRIQRIEMCGDPVMFVANRYPIEYSRSAPYFWCAHSHSDSLPNTPAEANDRSQDQSLPLVHSLLIRMNLWFSLLISHLSMHCFRCTPWHCVRLHRLNWSMWIWFERISSTPSSPTLGQCRPKRSQVRRMTDCFSSRLPIIRLVNVQTCPWTLVLQEILRQATLAPYSMTSGLCLLTELLPIPLPHTVRQVGNQPIAMTRPLSPSLGLDEQWIERYQRWFPSLSHRSLLHLDARFQPSVAEVLAIVVAYVECHHARSTSTSQHATDRSRPETRQTRDEVKQTKWM